MGTRNMYMFPLRVMLDIQSSRLKRLWLFITVVIKPPPAERKVHNLTGSLNAVEGFKCFQYDRSLLFQIARFAKRVTEWPFDKDSPGRFNLLGVLTNNGNAHGGNTCFFNLSLDQPDRLVADTSGGGQQDDVDAVLS